MPLLGFVSFVGERVQPEFLHSVTIQVPQSLPKNGEQKRCGIALELLVDSGDCFAYMQTPMTEGRLTLRATWNTYKYLPLQYSYYDRMMIIDETYGLESGTKKSSRSILTSNETWKAKR